MKFSIIALSVVFGLGFASDLFASTVDGNTSYVISPDEGAYNSYSRKFSATLGATLPVGPMLELLYRPIPEFNFGVSVGGMNIFLGSSRSSMASTNMASTNMSSKSFTLGTFGVEAKMHWHPWGRSFFIGVGGGSQSYGIYETFQSSATLSRIYLVPQIGWTWILDSGFTIGTELGVQLPLSSRLTHHEIDSAAKEVQSLLQIPLPYLNILKLGYSF